MGRVHGPTSRLEAVGSAWVTRRSTEPSQRPLRRLHHVRQQHRPRHRADAAGVRREPARDLGDRRVDVAVQLRLARSGRAHPGDPDIQHRGARLDPLGLHEVRHADRGDHDVRARTSAARSTVRECVRVTVASTPLRVKTSPSGRPTVRPRPMTTTCLPAIGTSCRRSSSTTPAGVHGSGEVQLAVDPEHEPAEVRGVQAVGVLRRGRSARASRSRRCPSAAAAARCSRSPRGRS